MTKLCIADLLAAPQRF